MFVAFEHFIERIKLYSAKVRKSYAELFYISGIRWDIVKSQMPAISYSLVVVFICCAFSFIAFCIALFFLIKAPSVSMTTLGTFGDFLGGTLNPIFSFLTLIGLAVTIILQRIELKKSHEEYTQTSSELKLQAIETTFFNMVSLHNNIVESLNLDAKDVIDFPVGKSFKDITDLKNKKFSGRSVFDVLYKIITASADVECAYHSAKTYKKIQNERNYIVGHYFRNLFQILNFINESDLIFSTKKKYANILRAQISTPELAILLINCIDDMVDDGQFKELLVKFSFLEHIPLSFDGNNSVVVSGYAFPLISVSKLKQYFVSKEMNAFGKNKFFTDEIYEVMGLC